MDLTNMGLAATACLIAFVISRFWLRRSLRKKAMQHTASLDAQASRQVKRAMKRRQSKSG